MAEGDGDTNYDSWSQPKLVAEVKTRLKAGSIDRSDLEYRYPDNMSKDDLRSALFWDDYEPEPCWCPRCRGSADFASGEWDTEAAQWWIAEMREQVKHNPDSHYIHAVSRYDHVMRLREHADKLHGWAEQAEPDSEYQQRLLEYEREARESERRWQYGERLKTDA